MTANSVVQDDVVGTGWSSVLPEVGALAVVDRVALAGGAEPSPVGSVLPLVIVGVDLNILARRPHPDLAPCRGRHAVLAPVTVALDPIIVGASNRHY